MNVGFLKRGDILYKPIPPAQTTEDRRAALEKANQSRKRRAAVRAELKAGTLTLKDVLLMDDPAIKRMRVSAMLASCFGIRDKVLERLMSDLKIAPSKRVGGLGPRQKEALLALEYPLRGHTRRREKGDDRSRR